MKKFAVIKKQMGMREKYNFLITPLNGRNAGTEVFRSLKLTHIYKKIVATDITDFSFGRHVSDAFYVQPYASSDSYIDVILQIVRKEKIDIIIPGSDYELRALSRHIEIFKKMHVYLLMNSPKVIELCMDKEATTKFLKDNNFPYIKTECFSFAEKNTHQLFVNLKRTLKCPFVVKPNYFSGGSESVLIIQDIKDWNAFAEINSSSQLGFIAQQYVDAPDQEYTIGVMSDTSGRIISSFALKRNLSNSDSIKLRVKNRYKQNSNSEYLIISSGVSQGLVKNYKGVRKIAEKVAVKLKSVGPLNIQCRVFNDKLYIFEINPRFSGTTSIRALLNHNDAELIFYSIVKNINLGQQKYKFASVVRSRDVVCKELKK